MKTVLITGANKGIGFETARQLAKLGYFVYLGSRNITNGQRAEQQLKNAGLSTVEAIRLDVTDIESIKKARAALESKIDALDILVNNAGIPGAQPQHISTCEMDNLRQIFETNYFGAIQTTQQFLPLLGKAKEPSIINVSSEVGSLGLHIAPGRNKNWDNFHAYGSSKTTLNAFTVMLANELEGTAFRVNSVTPGYTATDLNNFQGLKTVEQGAGAIVALAINPDRTISGKFFKEDGEVPW